MVAIGLAYLKGSVAVVGGAGVVGVVGCSCYWSMKSHSSHVDCCSTWHSLM